MCRRRRVVERPNGDNRSSNNTKVGGICREASRPQWRVFQLLSFESHGNMLMHADALIGRPITTGLIKSSGTRICTLYPLWPFLQVESGLAALENMPFGGIHLFDNEDKTERESLWLEHSFVCVLTVYA